MAIHFATFADSKMRRTLRRIEQEALRTGWFASVSALSDPDLGNEFWARHGAYVRANPKGFGFYLWKPWVVLSVLHKVAYGDVVVYADAGCEVVDGEAHKADISRYADALTKGGKDILGFQMPHAERRWTKADLFDKMRSIPGLGLTEEDMATGQVMATALVCKKSDFTMEFMHLWRELCSAERYRYGDNSPSVAPNSACFKEHRWDQSVFSLLCKGLRDHVVLLSDEVDTPNHPLRGSRLRFV